MPKRGHYPTQEQPELAEGELSEKIKFMQSLSNWEFTSDPEQVKFRVNWFFDQCAKADTRPTVALLAVALNTSRQTMWQWEQKGGKLGEIISQSKRILNALLEDWSVTGRINPVSAVWLQKNHFHYRDSFAFETSPQRPVDHLMLSPEEISRRIGLIPDYKSEEREQERRRIEAEQRQRIEQDIPLD